MKTKIYHYIFLFCFIIFPINQLICQDQPFLSFQENINLPKDNLGVMPDYIVEVDDVVNGIPVHKLYVYGMQGILIYNLNSPNWQDYPGKIEFTNEVFGFYDRSFQKLLDHPARIPMVYISVALGFGQLFAVGPDLRIWYVDVIDDTPHQCQVPPELTGYKLISAKLVYDDDYSRIVCLFNGRSNNSENSISGLYKVNLSAGLYTIQQVFMSNEDIISDFAINDIYSNNIIYIGVYHLATETGYWALLQRNDFQPIPDKQVPVNFRPGLIKYVHSGNVHQVYCLPGVNGTLSNTSIKFYDGNSSTHGPYDMISPTIGYTCAGFNDNRNYLYLGAYAGPAVMEFNDVYIFQFQNNTTPPILKCALNTCLPPKGRQNVALAIASVNQNEVLVMKRHEIIKLNFTGNNPCPYSYETLKAAYGNQFSNAEITDDSRIFITKMSGGFLEYDISNNPWILTNHQTGHSVHSSFISSYTGKKYFYSKDHFADNLLFMEENTGGSSITGYPMNNPVGGCLFNPFQNQILISDFRGITGPFLKAYSEIPGGLNCQYSGIVGGSTTNNGNVFITKDGKLLLMSGVNNSQPKVIIKDAIATDYEDIAEISLAEHFPGSSHLNVLFAGNRTQNYFVVGDDNDPESEESVEENPNNSYFYVLDPHNYSESPYIEIHHNIPRFLETMQAGELEDITIFKAFVAGNEHYFSEITIEDQYLDMTVTQKPVGNPITALKLISYYSKSGLVNKVFITTWDEVSNSTSIWTYEPGIDEAPVEISQINTYISKIDYDEATLLLYLYGIEFDELKVVQLDVLEQFAGEVGEINIHSLPTDKLAAFPVQTNELLFDHENHFIDIPNGEFSSISWIGFAFDRLHLKDKVSWFSFPRLDQANSPVPSVPVLEKIRPFPSAISMENLPLQEGDPPLKTKTYLNPGWDGDLNEIQSTFGYKLSSDNQYVLYQPMLGSILDPSTSISIYPGHENWVGYFPTWPQDPFDALAPVLDKLTLIKHHDWACVRVSCPGMGPGQPEPTCWMCSKPKPLKYADMLILECSENVTFHWGEEFSAEKRELPTPEHFVFSETADYTPIFIELDSTDQPLEIGAYIGSTCIGATTIETGDTTVMIRSYIPSDTSGIITFENYYGSEKALPELIDEYFVRNQETGIREKRVIDSQERKKFYLVSFKNETDSWFNSNPLKLNFFPNPGPASGILEYFIPEESDVLFELFDVYGRKLNMLMVLKQAAGNYSTSLLDLIPDESAQGIFLIKMSACGNSVTTKIIISR